MDWYYIIKFFHNKYYTVFFQEWLWLKTVEEMDDDIEEFFEVTEEEYWGMLDKGEID